jgi:hypothetical protein
VPDICKVFSRLILDGLYHLGMGMPGREHGNAAREIDIPLAVNIPDFGTQAVVDDKGIISHVRLGDDLLIALDDLPRLGPGLNTTSDIESSPHRVYRYNPPVAVDSETQEPPRQ